MMVLMVMMLCCFVVVFVIDVFGKSFEYCFDSKQDKEAFKDGGFWVLDFVNFNAKLISTKIIINIQN